MKNPRNSSSLIGLSLRINAYVCFYLRCTYPEVPEIDPSGGVFWSESSTWGGVLGPMPQNGSSVGHYPVKKNSTDNQSCLFSNWFVA